MEDGTYRTYTPTGTRMHIEPKPVHYQNGYQVGIIEGTWLEIHPNKETFTRPETLVHRQNELNIRIVNALVECAQETNASFVGVWTDEKTDIIHIDPSLKIHHRVNAVQMAEKNNQLSIWDWENMEEILKADW